MLSASSNLTYLRHQRYGHLSYRGLKTLLTNKRCIYYLNWKPKMFIVEIVLWVRNTTIFFLKRVNDMLRRLEFIHAYIYIPIKPISHSGNRYLFSFMIIFVRVESFFGGKTISLECFKTYKKLMKNEAKTFIKCLRMDKGGGWFV